MNVETAAADLLKLALVVVGLDRAPVNLLNPRHTNAEMVKALGGHHDNIVSQYTIWAITENASLGVSNLGIDIKNIEQQPPNVRAWLFQLLAMTPEDAARYQEYIVLGTQDPQVEARLGLAGGLKNTFFDGLETVVLDWFVEEGDLDVSQLLMDHMIRQARHCSHYEALVLDFYEKEPGGSAVRQRMEARAAGTPLYMKMKRLDASGLSDLFGGLVQMTNNINIQGGIQAGSVSVGGKAENTGAVSVHYNPQTVELIQKELAKAERELHLGAISDEALKKTALEHVQAAKADPSPDNISRAIEVLTKVESVATKTVAAGTAIGAIAKALGAAAVLM